MHACMHCNEVTKVHTYIHACMRVLQIMASRETPLNLILENSPGKKWHPSDRPPPPLKESDR